MVVEVREGPLLERFEFEAMGVPVECLASGADAARDAFEDVEREFRRLDLIFSRFNPDSELSRLNALGTMTVSEEMLEVTEAALAARQRTLGRFDPTVHDAVVAAGYDRTFREVPAESEGEGDDSVSAAPCGGTVIVDRPARTIVLEPGVRLDFGGIAKGYAVDRCCDLLEQNGPCLVNAGGDLAVRALLSGGPWPIVLDTPDGPLTLGLHRGAIATSGVDTRRWRRNGEERHHLIDPTTGRPAEGDILRVTVIGATAVEAEVTAKSLILQPERDAVNEANRLGLPCVLVTRDGRTVLAGGLA